MAARGGLFKAPVAGEADPAPWQLMELLLGWECPAAVPWLPWWLLGSQQGDPAVFSPAPCKVDPKGDFPNLPIARDLQVCSPVLLFSSHPKRKQMKKRQKII